MTDDSISIDYLLGLYNGTQAVAERVNPARLRHIHVKTLLDKNLIEWLESGRDVVLTGSPGDGKTHLLNYLDLPNNVCVEKDASQERVEAILQRWRHCRQSGQRYILAINHAPLRQLAELAADDPDLRKLHQMILPTTRSQSAIDNFVIYSDEQERHFDEEQPDILIVDLSQREILTDEIISELLNKLCPIAASDSCTDSLGEECTHCPLHENAAILAEPQVRMNLAAVLSLVARRGFHATMRDLIGLLAFILTGGARCTQLWRKRAGDDGPHYDFYNYYNLLFQGGRSSLFDALRHTFDPGEHADPRVDLELWCGRITDGWLISRSVGYDTPPFDLFSLKALKRRYFFEHHESISQKFRRMMTDVEQEFDSLLRETDDQSAVQHLVEMINLFYGPLPASQRGNYAERLYLWNQHRYSVGRPAGYVASRSVSAPRTLRVYHPRLNPWYGAATDVRKDHVLLAIRGWSPGAPALRVDWEMYKALWEARQGKAVEVQPYSILRRLDLFLRGLGTETGGWSAVETILWGDYRKRTVTTVKVDRTLAAYRE